MSPNIISGRLMPGFLNNIKQRGENKSDHKKVSTTLSNISTVRLNDALSEFIKHPGYKQNVSELFDAIVERNNTLLPYTLPDASTLTTEGKATLTALKMIYPYVDSDSDKKTIAKIISRLNKSESIKNKDGKYNNEIKCKDDFSYIMKKYAKPAMESVVNEIIKFSEKAWENFHEGYNNNVSFEDKFKPQIGLVRSSGENLIESIKSSDNSWAVCTQNMIFFKDACIAIPETLKFYPRLDGFAKNVTPSPLSFDTLDGSDIPPDRKTIPSDQLPTKNISVGDKQDSPQFVINNNVQGGTGGSASIGNITNTNSPSNEYDFGIKLLETPLAELQNIKGEVISSYLELLKIKSYRIPTERITKQIENITSTTTPLRATLTPSPMFATTAPTASYQNNSDNIETDYESDSVNNVLESKVSIDENLSSVMSDTRILGSIPINSAMHIQSSGMIGSNGVLSDGKLSTTMPNSTDSHNTSDALYDSARDVTTALSSLLTDSSLLHTAPLENKPSSGNTSNNPEERQLNNNKPNAEIYFDDYYENIVYTSSSDTGVLNNINAIEQDNSFENNYLNKVPNASLDVLVSDNISSPVTGSSPRILMGKIPREDFNTNINNTVRHLTVSQKIDFFNKINGLSKSPRTSHKNNISDLTTIDSIFINSVKNNDGPDMIIENSIGAKSLNTTNVQTLISQFDALSSLTKPILKDSEMLEQHNKNVYSGHNLQSKSRRLYKNWQVIENEPVYTTNRTVSPFGLLGQNKSKTESIVEDISNEKLAE